MINVVCALIFDEAGRVLGCRRPAGKAHAGKWEFPGGKIENGESAEAALAREIEEELGCSLSIGAAMTVVTHHYDDVSINLQPFRCTLMSGEVQLLEHAEVRWLALEECGGLEWVEADVPIWQSLLAEK